MSNRFPTDIGKMLVILGGVLFLVGLLFMWGPKPSWLGLGRLPGDIQYKGKNTSFYFPLTTCILISALVTVILWLISHFTRH